MHKYLMDEHPIMVYPSLAKKIGLNEAIFLQKLHGWLHSYQEHASDQHEKHWHKDRWWAWGTPEAWHEQIPFLSPSTIKRAIANLRERRLIMVDRFNALKIDRTNWYTIDYEVYDALWDQVDPSIGPKWADGQAQNGLMDKPKMDRPLPIGSSIGSPKTAAKPRSRSKTKGDGQDRAPPAEKRPLPLHLSMGDDGDLAVFCDEEQGGCGAAISIGQLEKAWAVCPSCDVGVYVETPAGKVICRPPQGDRAAEKAAARRPAQDSTARAFSGAPVDAFLEVRGLGALTPKVRAQWGAELRRVAADMDATPAETAAAIRLLDGEEHAWRKPANVYEIQRLLPALIAQARASTADPDACPADPEGAVAWCLRKGYTVEQVAESLRWPLEDVRVLARRAGIAAV